MDSNSSMNVKKDNSSNDHICLYCLKEVEGSSRCSRCRTALYCSKKCQEKHWPVHKNRCQDSNMEDSIEKLDMKACNHLKQGNYIISRLKQL